MRAQSGTSHADVMDMTDTTDQRHGVSGDRPVPAATPAWQQRCARWARACSVYLAEVPTLVRTTTERLVGRSDRPTPTDTPAAREARSRWLNARPLYLTDLLPSTTPTLPVSPRTVTQLLADIDTAYAQACANRDAREAALR